MKRARVLLGLFVALWLSVAVASIARAARPDACTEADGEVPCYLERGKRATYGGELNPSAFVRALLEDRASLQKTEAERDQAQADLEAEQKLRAIDRAETDAILAAERVAHAKTRELARALVEPPSWYERPSFIIPTTAAVTLGVVLAVWAAL